MNGNGLGLGLGLGLAMASVNKIILIGTVFARPDFRILSGGSMAVRLLLETTDSGQVQKHEVIFYGYSGKMVMESVRKGFLVFVEGKLRSHQYENRLGIRCTKTDIVAQKMWILGREKEDMAETVDLFYKDDPTRPGKEKSHLRPDLSHFEYDDW